MFVGQKRLWSDAQRQAVDLHFSRLIYELRLPGKKDIEQCIKTEPCLQNKSWLAIKDLLNARVQKQRKLAQKD